MSRRVQRVKPEVKKSVQLAAGDEQFSKIGIAISSPSDSPPSHGRIVLIRAMRPADAVDGECRNGLGLERASAFIAAFRRVYPEGRPADADSSN
eukprot:s3789_g6.t1